MTSSAPPGFRVTVLSLALGQLLSGASLYYMFSAFVLPMRDELGWNEPTLMGAFSLGLVVWGLCTYAVGAAIDRGHGRVVMTLGPVLGGVGFLAWSQVSAPWMFYAAWALLGLAMSMTLYEPAFNMLTRRFPTRYVQGITTVTMVAGFASSLAFPVVALLMGALGWRGALLVLAAMMAFVVAPLFAWCLRGPTTVVAGPAHAAASVDATLHQALRLPAFWLLTLCFAIYSFMLTAFWAHAMPAFVSKGLSQAQVLTVLVWIGPAQVMARMLFLTFGRHLSVRTLGAVVLGAIPLSMLLFGLAKSTALLIASALLFGLANGLVSIVRGNLVPMYFGRTQVGRISGSMTGICLLTLASAPLVVAWLLLLLPGYREIMLMLAGLGLLAMLAYLSAAPPPRRVALPALDITRL